MSAATAAGAPALCESCRLRPATSRVLVEGEAPFAVCAGCVPAEPVEGAVVEGLVVDDARPPGPMFPAGSPDLDWSGVAVLSPDWPAVVAWACTCAGLLAVALLCGLVWRSQVAFVAGGTVALLVLTVAARVWMALGQARRGITPLGRAVRPAQFARSARASRSPRAGVSPSPGGAPAVSAAGWSA